MESISESRTDNTREAAPDDWRMTISFEGTSGDTLELEDSEKSRKITFSFHARLIPERVSRTVPAFNHGGR